MAALRRLESQNDQEVREAKFREHGPATRRSALYLHSERDRGRAVDAEIPGDTLTVS